MTEHVVVLGSGYAGTGSVKSLEAAHNGDVELTWVSDTDYHLVLHESHRCIRDPDVREQVVIPVEEIKSPETSFRRGEVVDIDTDDRVVHLENDTVAYDYLLVCLGSQTAFFGVEGLDEHAHTLKRLDDALGIHEDVLAHAEEATPADPVRAVVGGAGLSGIQTAGELAELRDERGIPIDIHLLEGLDEILPDSDPGLQAALRERLDARGVTVSTGEFVREVDEKTVYVGETGELEYDVLVWTGGVTGCDAVETASVETSEQSGQIRTARDFRTDDDRVFAVGDCALIEQSRTGHAPPTAQAAWQAATVAGQNVARAVRGQPLAEWQYDNKGTVVSVGDAAVAHGVSVVPLVDTFGGLPARALKKAIAARWINDVAGAGRALRAWSDM
jgi:NADH dehydrogenase